jgi:cytochrome c556
MMKRILTAGTLAFAVGVASVAPAQDNGEADAAIKYRKDGMSAVGGHIRALVALLKGDVTNPDAVVFHAQALEASANSAILRVAFSQNTDGQGTVETTATGKIWEDWDGFTEQLDTLQTASAGIADLAEKGELTEFDQLKPALGTCGACHRKLGYRAN